MMDKKEAERTAPPYNKHNLQEQPMAFFSKKFEEADPSEVAERLQLPIDEKTGTFTVRMLGREIAVSGPSFQTKPELRDNSAKILLLRYLLFGRREENNGNFISFRDMPSGDLYIQPFTGRCIMRMNRKYGSRPDVLRRVLEGMGGKKVDYASVCYDLEFLPDLWVRFILWEGDDEFPASSQILFSENFKAAFETYDLAEVCGVCLNAFGAWEAEHAK